MVTVIVLIFLLSDFICTGEALTVSSTALMMVSRSNITEVFIVASFSLG